MKTFKILTTLLFLLALNANYAQKKAKVDEKTKHYFQTPEAVEKSDYKLEFKNIVSRFDYLKFAIILTNKSEDFIMDHTKSKIIYSGGEKTSEKDKIFQFKPFDSGNKTFMVSGGEDLLVKDFTFQVSGISKVPIRGRVEKVPDFKLPQSTNSIRSGNFVISLKGTKKKTDETSAKFVVQYVGDDVAVIALNEISLRVNESDVFANDNIKNSLYMLTKGEEMPFTAVFHVPAKVVDMQFADMFTQWNKCFSESQVVPLSGAEVTFKLDEVLTKDKN